MEQLWLEPKPKKYCRLPVPAPLPVITKPNGEIYKFSGSFNGLSVLIEDEEDMKKIISMGYFGKANFSRSYPQFQRNQPEFLRQRQFERRKKWAEIADTPKSLKKVVVLPDSDSENDDYFNNMQPKYEIDRSGIKENVYLTLEEAFFLLNTVECLSVKYLEKCLDAQELWALFSATEPHFIQNYIVYYYYRAKNFVVKPGIKFGGDYLLYKHGPPFYHASCVVIVDVLDGNMQRIDKFARRSMDKISIMGLNRLCETTGKDLIICQIIWPANEVDFTNLSNISIKEVIMKRWSSSHERQNEDT